MAHSPESRRRTGSKYTADRNMPDAFDGETVTRRRFMTGTAHSAGAVAAAAFTLPALGFAIGLVFDRASATWQDVGPLSDFSKSDYRTTVITIEPGLGEAGKSIAYVRKHNPPIDGLVKDKYDHIVAISSRCAHVGCPVRYVAASAAFVCPCHGGVYDFRGLRSGGPPPRPLDRFYTLISADRVLIGPRAQMCCRTMREGESGWLGTIGAGVGHRDHLRRSHRSENPAARRLS